MGKTYAVGLISALAASASLSQTNSIAFADTPFNFSTLFPSSSSSTTSNASSQSPSFSTSGQSPPSNSAQSAVANAVDSVPKATRNDNPRTTSAGSIRRHSREVFEVMKTQEATRQAEWAAKASEFKATQAQAETSKESGACQLQEESSIRQEQARRATEEQIQAQRRQTEREKADIERETIRVRAMAEAEGRAHEAKLSEDVNRRMLIDRANAEREKWVAAINTTFDHIGGGLRAILTDQNKLVVAVGGVTALAAGIYTTREGAKVIWSYVDRILGQPSLIRESSRGKYPWSGFFTRTMSTLSHSANKGSSKNGNGFGDVILHPSLQKRIEQLSNATANTKSHQAPFRNMLFYGPPGTGKTMAARELARKSGLDYALMTGGDVAPLGSQAVTKIHQLFDWAKKSKRGLLLFIDEADAFLCERNKTYMSEAQRSALNALLFRTGDQSKDIVLALATNRPGDLDSAVADRIDEVLEFPLPGEEERFKLLKLYLDKYIAQAGSRKSGGWFQNLFKKQQQKIEIRGLTDDILKEAAAKTEGFSGREIAKLMASIQAAVYGSQNCVLDPSLFREVVDYKVADINRGVNWHQNQMEKVLSSIA
ncbi:hypothetical protein GH714_039486 [Hevea brasiliensis]|uniref:AAA+ ATPase domain-containing protein n=1 Tax=Hevea brasiliensis TaxID=3981 RepID=A0A6A6MYJ5_HEVBR|nr:hypothetical protein GH714_039486 [Hevea brasiliensis]